MDFDGGKRKEFVNWKFEEKDMKILRTLTAVFTPAIALCFMFSVNVVKLDQTKRLPALHTQVELENLVEDESKTWYAQISKEKEMTVARR